MPSIYPNLKASDRKYIRIQKARIRREFLDFKKQEEMISELYERFVPKVLKTAAQATPVKEEKIKPEKESKKVESKPVKNLLLKK